jgi:hypothetical protein
MMQIKDYKRDVNDVGLAGPPTENSWFRHWLQRSATDMALSGSSIGLLTMLRTNVLKIQMCS